MWLLDQMDVQRSLWNVPAAIRLVGPLDVDLLEQCCGELLQRHEILRAYYLSDHGQPSQHIASEIKLRIEQVDVGNLPSAQREAEVVRLAQVESQRPFQLHHPPLMRVQLFRFAANDHVVLLTIHHIVTDGLSMGILLSELGTLYAARKRGEPSPLTDLPVQYVDYASWQRQCWSTDAFQASVEYWKHKLAGSPPALEFPSDRRRPAIQTFHGAVEYFDLPISLQDALQQLARQSGSTLFMTMLAAFKALLYRYTGQSDIVVGTFINQRHRRTVAFGRLLCQQSCAAN
jgi:hypothetical protein